MTNKYFIFYVKNEYLNLVEQYPSFLKFIFNESINSFFSKQNEEIFEPMLNKKIYLIEYLNKRMDFVCANQVYYILNKITDETITVKINEFSLEVTEIEGKHIIYDVLKEFSKNFYMILS